MCEEDALHFRMLLKTKDEEIARLSCRIKELINESDKLYERVKQYEAAEELKQKGISYIHIPNKVKIGFKDYDVIKVDGHVVGDNSVCYGTIQFEDGTINISTLYSEDLQECTLIHECLHGIDDIHEIGLEEDHIRKLAKGVYAFIKDNPSIFKEKR